MSVLCRNSLQSRAALPFSHCSEEAAPLSALAPVLPAIHTVIWFGLNGISSSFGLRAKRGTWSRFYLCQVGMEYSEQAQPKWA